MDWEVILGPFGVAVVSCIAAAALWRRHVRDDEVKDAAIKTLTDSVGQFPAALKDLTEVVLHETERQRTRPRNERAGDR